MWHERTVEETAELLHTDIKLGLSGEEAVARRKEKGPNKLPRVRRDTWYFFLLRQFKNPLVYILLFGAAVTFWLEEWIDFSVIMAAVLINVAVGFWQEFKSDNILKRLQEIVYVKSIVLRDGKIHELPSHELVPGDIVYLKQGLKVPADVRVTESHGLLVNQAALTGESIPDEKGAQAADADLPLADIPNMAYMGTVVQSGYGTGIVVHTGGETEIGKIALLTKSSKDEKTPLQQRMSSLGKKIAILVGIFAVTIFAIGAARDFALKEILITSIAVAVAGVPEGLPAAISIILAVSAQRILRRKGVIRSLVAAETLGSASVICTDKTGTLTEGKMVIEDVVLHHVEKEKPVVRRILALANEALIEEEKEGGPRAVGEPTDVAKMDYFLRAGGNMDALMRELPRIGFISFNPKNKYIAAFHKDKDENIHLFVTGAPESVMDRTAKNHFGTHSRTAVEDEHAEYAERGFRVIAMGYKNLGRVQGIQKETERDLERHVADIEFIGLAVMRDPVRPDVEASIREAKNAGVRTVMITGDHKLTALAIARELGIAEDDEVILGSDFEKLSDDELAAVAERVNVYARVAPEHKMRLIRALRGCGEVVAMTGDGINDAPALKAADIGTALGSGTDVAKEASDLVLLNNSFSTIVESIKQGRIAFDNIKKVTVLILTSTFSEVILVMSSLVIPLFWRTLGVLPLPVTALQILYSNLIEDTLPNIALAFEPGEADTMRRPPNARKARILDYKALYIILGVGLASDVLLVGLFLWLFLSGMPTQEVQSIMFAAISLDTLFYAFSVKSLRKPVWRTPLANNWYLLAALFISASAVFIALYLPAANTILGTIPLSADMLLLVASLAALKAGLIEVVKAWFRRREDDAQPAPHKASSMPTGA